MRIKPFRCPICYREYTMVVYEGQVHVKTVRRPGVKSCPRCKGDPPDGVYPLETTE